METKYFEDFEVGDQFETKARTITTADQLQYAGLSGNYDPIHLDEEKMRDSEYGGRLVYGLLILSVMEGQKVQTGLVEDSVIAFYGIEDVRFTHPVYIGDTIHTELKVEDLERRDASSGVVTLEENAINQADETVVTAQTKTLVKARN